MYIETKEAQNKCPTKSPKGNKERRWRKEHQTRASGFESPKRENNRVVKKTERIECFEPPRQRLRFELPDPFQELVDLVGLQGEERTRKRRRSGQRGKRKEGWEGLAK